MCGGIGGILLADRDASHAPVLHTNERLEEALGRWMSCITVMPNLARNSLPSLRVDQRADDRIVSTPRLLVRDVSVAAVVGGQPLAAPSPSLATVIDVQVRSLSTLPSR